MIDKSSAEIRRTALEMAMAANGGSISSAAWNFAADIARFLESGMIPCSAAATPAKAVDASSFAKLSQ